MALPLLALAIPALTTAARFLLGSVIGVLSVQYAERKARAYMADLSEQLIGVAAEKMGLDLSADGQLTDESVTAAVNNNLLAGTGLQIDSLLDRDKLRAGLEKLAVQKLAEQVGIPLDDTRSIAAVRSNLQAWAMAQVEGQLDAEAGAVFDAAPASNFIGRVIAEAPKNAGWNVATDMTPKGIANRQRQARYRQAHKRTWIKRGEK